ncbi:hypothetical protein WJX82_002538 [Trebouxia sp. C0006]
MLAEAEAASLDENFATIIIRDDEMKEYLKQHHDYRLLDQAKNLSRTAVESLTGVQYGCTKAMRTTRFLSNCTMMGLCTRASPAGALPGIISNKGQQHGWVPMPWGEVQPFIPDILGHTKPLYSEVKVWNNSQHTTIKSEHTAFDQGFTGTPATHQHADAPLVPQQYFDRCI